MTRDKSAKIFPWCCSGREAAMGHFKIEGADIVGRYSIRSKKGLSQQEKTFEISK